MAELLLEFAIIGIAGGLLGMFYRNCLKANNMIFNFIYKELQLWVLETDNPHTTDWDKFKAWIAFPLGYCCYCSTTWITFILCAIYLSSWDIIPKWQDIVIGVVLASGIQHLIVCASCRWLINKHPDLDPSNNG